MKVSNETLAAIVARECVPHSMAFDLADDLAEARTRLAAETEARETAERELATVRERLAILGGSHRKYRIRPDTDGEGWSGEPERWMVERKRTKTRLHESSPGVLKWDRSTATLFDSADEAFAALSKAP